MKKVAALRVLTGCLLFSSVVLGPPALWAQPFAYVSNQSDDTVSVIDTASHSVINTVTVGDGPYGVAVLPDGSAAYIANTTGNSVSVIEAPSHRVVATINVGLGCYGIAADPDGSRVYATSFGSDWLSVIDTSTNTNVGNYPVGSNPYLIAVHPAGTFVYITNQFSEDVSVFDTTQLAVVDTIPLSFIPGPIAVHPDGSAVYVAGGQGISVIDTTTNLISDFVPIGGSIAGVAVHPDGSVVFAATRRTGDDLITVIDTETNTYFDDEPVGETPAGVAVHPDGKRVYVVERSVDSVAVFQVYPFLRIDTIDVGAGASALGRFVGLTRPDEILADGFESGTICYWSTVVGSASCPGLPAIGSITTVPAANHADGEYFVLNDGVNPAATFEFETLGNGVSPGRIPIDIRGDTTADDVRHSISVAINVSGMVQITANIGGTATVDLTNNQVGETGNRSITEQVAHPGFTVLGMDGGMNPTP